MEIYTQLKNLKTEFSEIKLVMLFGSYARNDNDENSDIDIFVLIDDCNFDNYIKLKNLIANYLQLPLDYLSIYTKQGIELLKNKGSYFLWHLKLEGILIYSDENEFDILFNNLKKYFSAKRDLIEYKQICEDIICNKRNDFFDKAYDLSVIASLIRNTCIAICYCFEKYYFDKIKSVNFVKSLMGDDFPFSIEEYLIIYSYRINKNRNITDDLIEFSNHDIIKSAKNTLSIINYGLDILNAGGNKND